MKISIFTQELSVTGAEKTITGRIVVTMNHSSKTISGTHASTHDDYTKTIPTHKVEGYIGDKVWWTQTGIESENLLLSESERCKKQLYSDITTQANLEPTKTFLDKMADLGFTIK